MSASQDRELFFPQFEVEVEAVFETLRSRAHLHEQDWVRCDEVFSLVESVRRDAGPEWHRLLSLYRFLDRGQLSCLMAGVPFQFGVARVAACAFRGAGHTIHLRLDRESSRAAHATAGWGTRLRANDDGWLAEPVCGQQGASLAPLDDSMYADLVETVTAFGNRYDAGRRLSCNEALAKVCFRCVTITAERYTGCCKHGATPRLCGGCADEAEQLRSAALHAAVTLANQTLAAASVTGQPRVAELRLLPGCDQLRQALQAARDAGNANLVLASALGWHSGTLARLLDS